jgi:uncharacterized protein YjbJ (UPF0337 family)
LPNKDEVKGKFDQAKGLLKGKIGRSLGDQKMKDEGDTERARGQIREGLGKSSRRDSREDRQSDREVIGWEMGKLECGGRVAVFACGIKTSE